MDTEETGREGIGRWILLTTGLGVAMTAVVVTGVVLTTPPAAAHKEHHDGEAVNVFKELFMEQVIIGDRLFHGDAELQKEMDISLSNTGMACAMCHPHTKDTNPHEFPKFQEQMSEFAALRDMTNWCIDKPNEGTMIEVDSPAMKALEAYMHWSHKGSPMNAGEH